MGGNLVPSTVARDAPEWVISVGSRVFGRQSGSLFFLGCGREMAGVGDWFELSVSMVCG